MNGIYRLRLEAGGWESATAQAKTKRTVIPRTTEAMDGIRIWRGKDLKENSSVQRDRARRDGCARNNILLQKGESQQEAEDSKWTNGTRVIGSVGGGDR
jgi:hypothetical protein